MCVVHFLRLTYAMMATREFWSLTLASSALGFVLGIFAVIWSSKGDLRYYSRYGFEFGISILGGRAFSPQNKPRGLLLIPKATLAATLCALIVPVWSTADTAGLVHEHWLFLLLWLACALSITLWLVNMSAFLREANSERTAQIDEFLSDSSALVPSGPPKPPTGTIVWNYFNHGLYLALMLVAALSLRVSE